jgi:hypothetical protein
MHHIGAKHALCIPGSEQLGFDVGVAFLGESVHSKPSDSSSTAPSARLIASNMIFVWPNRSADLDQQRL